MNDGKVLEKHVQHVYNSLLNLKDEGVVVEHDYQLRVAEDQTRQIDVYYEFVRAGVTHKVAIECKDHGRPIDVGYVDSFVGKMSELPHIQKVMVSRMGFQEGAIKQALRKNVILLSVDDLPNFTDLLVKRLSTVGLPDESAIGEPFWTIMEIRDGKVTGSFKGEQDPSTGRGNIFLFFSRKHAERLFKQGQLDPNEWCIRGMPQYVFRSFLIQLELYESRGDRAVLALPPHPDHDVIYSMPISRKQLIDDYYIGDITNVLD